MGIEQCAWSLFLAETKEFVATVYCNATPTVGLSISLNKGADFEEYVVTRMYLSAQSMLLSRDKFYGGFTVFVDKV